MSGLINPADVPTHLTDRAHAICRDIVDQVVAVRADGRESDPTHAWLADIGAVVTAAADAPGGDEHYQSILAGVAALAVGRLAVAQRDGVR